MKSMSSRVAVVVPTHNRRALSETIVKSLSADGYPSKTIFVCDSDSTDGTREAVSQYPNTVALNVGSEKWWSGAVNAGIKKAFEENFEYVLLLNDDLNLPTNLIAKLVGIAQRHPQAIITAAQSAENGLFLGQRIVGQFRNRQEVTAPGRDPVEIDLINGCCLLIPADVFRKIGIIDEVRCPHLAGDNEFLLRARNAGFRLLVVPDVIVGQGHRTDLRSRYCFRKLLTAPYSPYRLDTHLAIGRQMFGSWLGLTIFGVWYNTRYLLGLIKASLIAVFRNRCL